MEATGFKFYNNAGVQTNCLQILADRGINTIRLRVWVNPSNDKTNGHCSKKETVLMAMRAKAMGMRVMIDFHYSDSWADPGKQTKPAAWANHSFSQLLTDVYNHTFEVLDTLKQCGVTPQWVQIGNEIAGGMLWPDAKLWAPDGSSANWPNLAQLLTKGYYATKAVDSSIKVVIHLESGNDNSKCRWFFDNAKALGIKYDIIGLSYYPYWIGSDYTVTINDLGNNMNDMVARYGKEVMVVEVGGVDNQVQNTYDMLVAVIGKTLAVPAGKGLGVIYWEPEGERSWSGGYPLSCWKSDGKPTAALDAFLTNTSGLNLINRSSDLEFYPNPSTGGILNFEFTNPEKSYELRILDMEGKVVKQQTVSGSAKNQMQLNLLPGIYLAYVGYGNYFAVKKLVIK
jgi:arabinogalactan endo-1,4-beta-galactosidase